MGVDIVAIPRLQNSQSSMAPYWADGVGWHGISIHMHMCNGPGQHKSILVYSTFWNFGTARAHWCWRSHHSKVPKQFAINGGVLSRWWRMAWNNNSHARMQWAGTAHSWAWNFFKCKCLVCSHQGHFNRYFTWHGLKMCIGSLIQWEKHLQWVLHKSRSVAGSFTHNTSLWVSMLRWHLRIKVTSKPQNKI